MVNISTICLLTYLVKLQPYWQPHNRAVARRIQNMGWRADGGLWLLVRGGGLYLSKGTGVVTLEKSHLKLFQNILTRNPRNTHISFSKFKCLYFT